MTTKTTSDHRRNTNKVDGLGGYRSRSWFFTLNNYTTECADQMTRGFSKYSASKYIFQEEIGENKTAHFQGIVTFTNKVSFENMKEIHNKAHWEVPKKTRACYNYCQKEATRKPDGKRWIYPDKNTDKLSDEDMNIVLYNSMVARNITINRADLPNGFFEVAKPLDRAYKVSKK